jgi:hypothetical protein
VRRCLLHRSLLLLRLGKRQLVAAAFSPFHCRISLLAPLGPLALLLLLNDLLVYALEGIFLLNQLLTSISERILPWRQALVAYWRSAFLLGGFVLNLLLRLSHLARSRFFSRGDWTFLDRWVGHITSGLCLGLGRLDIVGWTGKLVTSRFHGLITVLNVRQIANGLAIRVGSCRTFVVL